MAKKSSGGKRKRSVMQRVDAGDINGLKELVAAGVDVNDVEPREENSALVRALELRNPEMVRALLDLGHNPNWGGVANPLARAICARDRPMVDLLLERGADVNAEEEEGDTPLLFAAGRGDLDLVRRLLDVGADIRHTNRDGCDALDFAVRGTSKEMLEFLLPQFPASRQDVIRRQSHLVRETQRAAEKAEEERKNEAARSPAATPAEANPLIKAFVGGKHERFLQLLAEGADPNETNDEGTTLLAMLCASWSGIDLVEPTLKAGAEPNRQSKFIPLKMAAANGAEAVVQSLLNAGADVHARSESDSTALISAASSGSIEVAKLLLNSGADPNVEDVDGRSAYRQAIECNNPDIADLLRPLTRDIEGAEKPWRANKEGKSLERRLLAAAESGDAEYVHHFLAEGVSPDIADESFRSPLHHAAEGGHIEVLNALIEAEAPLDVPAFRGWTPLFFAIRAGKIDAVRRLVEAGASLSAIDSEGRDALAFAKESGCDEVAELIASRA